MAVKRILIVEDEETIVEVVTQAMRRHGYETASASDGDDALEKVFSLRPDLVILDLMLPKMDGWEVCRRIKAERETERIPILMLTARRDERDLVEGLELGADDYMKKPFSLAELAARVKALLRRTGERDEGRILENGDLRIELDEETALLRGAPLDLSPTEFRLLDALARKMGRTATREELLGKIWSLYGGDTRTVDVHISRLRKKLDDGKRPALVISSLRGRGYRLMWGSSAAAGEGGGEE
jgi:two-component system phosphate regulon response regulator PhoB/two-component system alkaline phosphatase synthesis response regulator PhoP